MKAEHIAGIFFRFPKHDQKQEPRLTFSQKQEGTVSFKKLRPE